jgi:16S rRNA (uracil1498-N3)-methyltransferase
MTQFLVKSENIKNGEFIINDTQLKHLVKVLRVKPFDKIRIFDGYNKSFIGEIVEISKDYLRGFIIKEIITKQNKICLNLFQSLIKINRFELILEKVTELGVNKIIPMLTRRTIIKIPENKIKNKIERWKKILVSASEQCCRVSIPELYEIIKFENVMDYVKENELNLIAYEHENLNTLKEIFSNINYKLSTINIFIGPEGGFTVDEIEFVKKNKFITFGLGNNILRSETAAIVSCGLILNDFLSN